MIAQAPAQKKTTMRAAVYSEYGSPDVLELREIEKPVPEDDEVLVRVRAASVNPFDWHMLTGVPYIVRMMNGLRRPKSDRLGADFAGTVEEIGSNVTEFRVGDDVFGVRTGAFGEYVCVREEGAIAHKPDNLSHEEAAAVGVAALTALQGLRDQAQVRSGQKVLINGASGGVGTFAVQIAKALGAEVTGVCSSANVERARSLGADRVVDYTREDFTRDEERYDAFLDIAGNRSWRECRRILNPDARLVCVGGPKTGRFVGSFGRRVVDRLASTRTSQKVVLFIAKPDKDDLETLSGLLEAGTVTPVVDRRYELGEVREALSYLAQGHAQGKIVVTV
jgi:NADPH:quinone reductase-like Zn-dependent oxidoreductase